MTPTPILIRSGGGGGGGEIVEKSYKERDKDFLVKMGGLLITSFLWKGISTVFHLQSGLKKFGARLCRVPNVDQTSIRGA